MLDKNTLSKSEKNILSCYLAATELEVINGEAWYGVAHKVALSLARKYELEPRLVACIISVLSPGVTWEYNVAHAERLLDDYTHENVNGSYTLYERNTAKALSFLACQDKAYAWMSQDISKLASGHKTISFANNIWDSTNPQYVTIDRHAARASMFGTEVHMEVDIRLSKKAYLGYVADFVSVAKLLGLEPCALQATVWLVIRRLYA